MQMLLWTALISVLIIPSSAVRMLVDQCGTSIVGPKIVDGENAEREAAAWMAAIRNENKFQCGGTVIHRRFVLTAAHCIEDQSQLFVMLGAYNKSRIAEEYNVILALPHYLYDRNRNTDHDIGLLKLSKSIQFGLIVYPICIVLNHAMKSRVKNMNVFEAYGWGTTRTKLHSDILQKITLYRVHSSQCNQFLDQDYPLTSNQLCVGTSDGDTCSGDSGGPLTNKFLVSGQELQVQLGIVSFGRRRCNGVGIYTDVLSFANWIEWNVNKYQWYTPGYKIPELPGNIRISHPAPGSQYRPTPGFGTNPPSVIGGSQNRPPPGFGTNPPWLIGGSQNYRPHGFSTSGREMFLYDQCGADNISMSQPVKIYGDEFEGKGVMITNRYVLTNAKDLPSDPATLEVLTINDNFLDELKVTSIIKHPDFSGDFHHDIALLKLTQPASLSGNRQPICMLLQARNILPTTRFPMEIHTVDSSECSDRINREIELEQLCIEEPKGTTKYYYTGDIVGVKMGYKGKDQFILFGIVSYSSNGLIILTNIMKYTNWIAGIVRTY